MRSATFLNIEELVDKLRLREGQTLVGKILRTSDHEVLLGLAGKTLVAQVEGQPLAAGTLALFKVGQTPTGKIELKVLSLLPEVAVNSETNTALSQLQALLLPAWQTSGPERVLEKGSPGSNYSNGLANNSPDIPVAEVWAFLAKHKLPLTAGTVLYAWLNLDRRLRDRLWNLILSSSSDRPEQLGLPQIVDLANGSVPDESGQTQLAPRLHSGKEVPGESLEKGEMGQIKRLLEESAGFEAALSAKLEEGCEPPVPLLVRTPNGAVTEYRVEWKTSPSPTGDPKEPEARLKLTIPTENLGEIYLTMLISPSRLRVGLKTGSGAVRDYLAHHLPDLQTLLGRQAQITVGVNTGTAQREGRFERWM